MTVRIEVLYDILIEFGIPIKLLMLIRMCTDEAYSKLRIRKNMSGAFPIQIDLKKVDVSSHHHFFSALL
jgi:hypothetical protein